MPRLTVTAFTAPCPALGPSVLWRREWVGGALLAGDWARDEFDPEAACGGPLDQAELTSGADGFDAFDCVAGFTVLLISSGKLAQSTTANSHLRV